MAVPLLSLIVFVPAAGADRDDGQGTTTAGQLEGTPTAQGVPDEVCLLDPLGIELTLDQVEAGCDGERCPRGELLAAEVTGQRRREDRVARLERRQDRLPGPPGVSEAVQQHQRAAGAPGVERLHALILA